MANINQFLNKKEHHFALDVTISLSIYYIAIANLKNVNCNLHPLQLQEDQITNGASQSNSKKNTA